MSTFFVISEDSSHDGIAVIALSGEIDYGACPEMRERIFGRIKEGVRRMVLDLSEATFIDSSAIGVLVGALTRLREHGGGSLAVVCPDGDYRLSVSVPGGGSRVREIIEIAGIDAGVALCSSREEALSDLLAAR